MKRAAIVLGIPLVLLLAGHAPGAWACSCVGGLSQADYEEMATHVFVGTATDSEDPDGGGEAVSSGRTIYWDFDVARVTKGDLGASAIIETSADGASCGYLFRIGHKYRVYVDEDGDRLTTGLCAGNEHLGPDPSYRAPDETPADDPETPVSSDDDPVPADDGPRPTPDGIEPAEDEDLEANVIAAPQTPVDTDGGGPGLAIGLAVALVAVGGAGFVATRRRRATG